MKDADHVYTKDELIKTLTDFTDGLSEDQKAAIDPKLLTSLSDVSDGINQLFSRINTLDTTTENLKKANEDYKMKISSYAADQAERMRQSLNNGKEKENQADEALRKLKDEDNY